MIMIDVSAGLLFLNDGGAGMPGGRSGIAAAIWLWTSTVAPSMSRSSANCSVTFDDPEPLDDVMSSRPAMLVNWRSSGLATDDAIVPGSAPGSAALTLMVGKST